jgi:hypothetical protein
MMLSPGMGNSREQEYPILGLDLKGKAAVQFLFFTGPSARNGKWMHNGHEGRALDIFTLTRLRPCPLRLRLILSYSKTVRQKNEVSDCN